MKGTEILDLLDLYHKATLAFEGGHINQEEWKLYVWDILGQLRGGEGDLIVKKLICFFKRHDWSRWMPWITGDKDYRFCHKCGRQELRG